MTNSALKIPTVTHHHVWPYWRVWKAYRELI